MAPQDTETEQLLRERLDEVQARLVELAKAPEPGAGIGFGKRIGDGHERGDQPAATTSASATACS